MSKTLWHWCRNVLGPKCPHTLAAYLDSLDKMFTVQEFHEQACRCKRYLEESSAQPVSIEFFADLQLLRSRARRHKYVVHLLRK